MNNTVPLLDIPFATPVIRGHRVTLVRAGAALWRVTAPDGRVLGHLRAISHDLGLRYRAERRHPATGAFVGFGEFWSCDDAVAALI
ncbi:MAG: hypothetical protein QM607_00705 [Microbacterium sp.]